MRGLVNAGSNERLGCSETTTARISLSLCRKLEGDSAISDCANSSSTYLAKSETLNEACRCAFSVLNKSFPATRLIRSPNSPRLSSNSFIAASEITAGWARIVMSARIARARQLSKSVSRSGVRTMNTRLRGTLGMVGRPLQPATGVSSLALTVRRSRSRRRAVSSIFRVWAYTIEQ